MQQKLKDGFVNMPDLLDFDNRVFHFTTLPEAGRKEKEVTF